MYPQRQAIEATRTVCKSLLGKKMKALIVGCGWVGTYVASRMISDGHSVWATCTSSEKALRLMDMGCLDAHVVDFAEDGSDVRLDNEEFDLLIVSVPVRRKDSMDVIKHRFAGLQNFLRRLSFRQSFYFSSVGIYPRISATITEDTFSDEDLDTKLLTAEAMLRADYPELNILRLGGLFGFDRIMARYFVDKVCQIGYQTANSVHVVDIFGIIWAMVKQGAQGKTYNVVCPEHPLKKEVIEVSAAKYGYGLPMAYTDSDRTAKIVSSSRLVAELAYRFVYPSPLRF